MIQSIRFPEELVKNVGLRGSTEVLRDLRKLVVLAGPNGAGKSRYLNAMQRLLAQGHPSKITAREQGIAASQRKASRYEGQLNAEKSLVVTKARITSEQHQLESARSIQLQVSGTVAQSCVPLTYQGHRDSIPLTGNIPPNQATSLVQQASTPGFISAFGAMHAYFTEMATRLFERELSAHRDNAEILEAVKSAEQFNEILDRLVSGHVAIESKGGLNRVTTFRGRPFTPAELSEGEAILVTWAIILHQQGAALSDAILIIDEPENHLHPDACVKALEALQKILGEHGQIWVATHALQIIAYAGLESILFVEDGRIAYGGNRVTEVIERLLGGPEGRRRLRGFLDDAEDIAFRKFAAECLTEPNVAPHKEKDDQEVQFVRLLEQRRSEAKPLRILDFGAGRGRLAKALYEARCAYQAPTNLPAIEYFAYNDASAASDELADCRNHLSELATAPGVGHTETVGDLRRFYVDEATKMDLVVLCNVLHEIRVSDWVQEFRAMAKILRGDGVVILMEDQRMSIGELPNAEGFLVLDETEVAALFGVGPRGKVRSISNERGGRLSAIEIRAEVLPAISKSNVDTALKMVMERAEKRIKELRGRVQKNFQYGREHTYYSMLYMNAKLALSE